MIFWETHLCVCVSMCILYQRSSVCELFISALHLRGAFLRTEEAHFSFKKMKGTGNSAELFTVTGFILCKLVKRKILWKEIRFHTLLKLCLSHKRHFRFFFIGNLSGSLCHSNGRNLCDALYLNSYWTRVVSLLCQWNINNEFLS